MSLETDRIFALLPAFLRLRDAEEGRRIKGRIAPGDAGDREAEDFGPLRTLASLIAREAQITEDGIDQLYADAFIETCAPWAIPYIGEMLGVRGLQDIPEGIDMRARVANALDLRSRKGTLEALEQVATDASGWPVAAVEYWRRIVHAQSVRLPHPEMGRSVDLRDRDALARIGGAFARTARGVDVRRIDTQSGKWMLGNIGLHVWRLKPYKITSQRVRPVAAGRRHFRFHPFECDAQLFAPLGLLSEPGSVAQEAEMPGAINREVFAQDVARFYGPNAAFHVEIGGDVVPIEDICAANLGDLPGGGAEPPWNHGSRTSDVLIDPELGRLVVGSDFTGVVRITCHFARVLDIGGGEHERALTAGSLDDATVVPAATSIVTRVTSAGGTGTFTLGQSSAYTGGGTITVPAGEVLRIVAQDGRSPTWRVPAAGVTFDLGDAAQLELNGLRVMGGAITVTGTGASARFVDCTLCPGLSLDRLGAPTAPGAPSLIIDAAGMALRLTRCITGPLRLAQDVDAQLVETIVDASDRTALAIGPVGLGLRNVLSAQQCTILGRTEVGRFAGGSPTPQQTFGVELQASGDVLSSDTIFAGRVTALERQVGCIRFSFLPPDSETPRLFRSVSAPAPQFEATSVAAAQYMLLAWRTDDLVARGAENNGEIGCWNRAAHQARADNIRRVSDDFLRFGHAAGLFIES